MFKNAVERDAAEAIHAEVITPAAIIKHECGHVVLGFLLGLVPGQIVAQRSAGSVAYPSGINGINPKKRWTKAALHCAGLAGEFYLVGTVSTSIYEWDTSADQLFRSGAKMKTKSPNLYAGLAAGYISGLSRAFDHRSTVRALEGLVNRLEHAKNGVLPGAEAHDVLSSAFSSDHAQAREHALSVAKASARAVRDAADKILAKTA